MFKALVIKDMYKECSKHKFKKIEQCFPSLVIGQIFKTDNTPLTTGLNLSRMCLVFNTLLLGSFKNVPPYNKLFSHSN